MRSDRRLGGKSGEGKKYGTTGDHGEHMLVKGTKRYYRSHNEAQYLQCMTSLAACEAMKLPEKPASL